MSLSAAALAVLEAVDLPGGWMLTEHGIQPVDVREFWIVLTPASADDPFHREQGGVDVLVGGGDHLEEGDWSCTALVGEDDSEEDTWLTAMYRALLMAARLSSTVEDDTRETLRHEVFGDPTPTTETA